MKPFKVILSGGGTGGHIYPAIAIANEIKLRYPQADILFVGANDRMEMEKVPEAGYPIKGISIAGIQRKLSLENLKLPFKVINSLRTCRKIIKDFKPDLVIGTGGYASGPLVYAAAKLNVPALIQEQNSYAGVTNKLLAKQVDKICVAFKGMESFFPANKIEITGNPVREDIVKANLSAAEARKALGLDENKKTLLVIGGSLGARRINQLIEKNIALFEDLDVQVYWQCGKLYYEEYKQYNSETLKVSAFIQQMEQAYAAADFIISRAGALSIAELCIVAKPSIFIPSPNVAEDHQTKNAQAIVDENAAIMIREAELDSNFETEFKKLLADENLQKQLGENIIALAKPNATKHIVDIAEKILTQK